MRRHAVVEDAATLRVRDHVAWSGDGPEGLHRLAADVFGAGARTGERMMFVAEDPDPDLLAVTPDLRRLLADGVLEVASLDAVYGSSGAFDPDQQLATFTEALEAALADGFTGLRVVADNTPLVRGGDQDVATWLAWEQITDQFQATRPVLGVCYFDRQQLTPERLRDLASVHPVVSASAALPEFRVFRDDDALWISGGLDTFAVDRLRRVLSTTPRHPEIVVDVSQCDVINHHALLVFEEHANSGTSIRLRNASSAARRVWELLQVPGSRLQFE